MKNSQRHKLRHSHSVLKHYSNPLSVNPKWESNRMEILFVFKFLGNYISIRNTVTYIDIIYLTLEQL